MGAAPSRWIRTLEGTTGAELEEGKGLLQEIRPITIHGSYYEECLETFSGAKEFMESMGVEVINLESEECKEMMRKFIAENPKLWFEDIGEL